MRELVEYSEFHIHILYKLYTHHYWGEKHTNEDNVRKGKPPHVASEIRHALEGLIKEGLILRNKKTGDWHISLNPARSNEIKQILNLKFC